MSYVVCIINPEYISLGPLENIGTEFCLLCVEQMVQYINVCDLCNTNKKSCISSDIPL